MRLFVFGSTGDLVKRKIMPAFVSLHMPELEIIALGRKELTDESYEKFVCDDCFKDFVWRPKYQRIEFGDSIVCEHCDQFLELDKENFFYSALPPGQIGQLLSYVSGIKRGGYKVKLLIEKPFGSSLKSAVELKEMAEKFGLLSELFISDHYLFKERIMSLSPRPFSLLKLVSLEKVGLENRAGYFNQIGALKDMMQSHFLNIVFRLLPDYEAVFKNMEVVTYEKGQYGNGVDEGYAKDLGSISNAETYFRVILKAGGKKFEFISGKRFDQKVGVLEIDGRKIDFTESDDDYTRVFKSFFSNDKSNFVTVKDSILAWEVLEKIEAKQQPLKFYLPEASADLAYNGLIFEK